MTLILFVSDFEISAVRKLFHCSRSTLNLTKNNLKRKRFVIEMVEILLK